MLAIPKPEPIVKEVIAGEVVTANPMEIGVNGAGIHRDRELRALDKEGDYTGAKAANSLHLVGPEIAQSLPEVDIKGRGGISIAEVAQKAGAAAEADIRGRENLSGMSPDQKDHLLEVSVATAKNAAIGVAGEMETRLKINKPEADADKISLSPQQQGNMQPIDAQAIGMTNGPLQAREGLRQPIAPELQQGLKLGPEQMLADAQLGERMLATAGLVETVQKLARRLGEEIGLLNGPTQKQAAREAVQAPSEALAITVDGRIEQANKTTSSSPGVAEEVNLRELIELSLQRRQAA